MSGRSRPAQRLFEGTQQIGIFLQFGKYATPAADRFDVESPTLTANDAFDVREVARAGGHQLVDDEVLGGTGPQDDAGRTTRPPMRQA